MCDEFRGPIHHYEKLGISHLWLRTVDHFEPSFQHLKSAVQFIDQNHAMGTRVYVHCRAGHGRSAAVALAWLLYNNPHADAKTLNRHLVSLRNVRSYLWRQPNIQKFQTWLHHYNQDQQSTYSDRDYDDNNDDAIEMN